MIRTAKRIDMAIEKKIITGMIVSSKYLQEVYPLMKLDYFKNNYTKTIAKWCRNYYENYDKAPYIHIEDIFLRNKDAKTVNEDEYSLISTLLTEVSQRHEINPDINVDYLVDNTIEYFDKREMEIRINNVQVLLDEGRVTDAKEQYLMYAAPERMSSEWTNPISQKSITKMFMRPQNFFCFPGQLGEFLGNMNRGWLVGITGPFKRGKSFMILEFAIIAILSGLRVAIFSLEMGEDEITERIAKRITGYTSDNYRYPCFDCKCNQDDSCMKPERRNRRRLLDPDGNKPEYSTNIRYQPCTWCRTHSPMEYELETWFEEIQRPDFTEENVIRHMETFEKYYGKKLRVRTYPRFSASVREIKRDLNILDRQELFYPDMIIVDYADILKSENPNVVSGVEKEDITWMSLGGLAGEKNALVITPTQATKQALDVANVKAKHTARWVGKLGHVDVMLTLNQLATEKEHGIMRIGIMEHRHKHFIEGNTVTILQKLSAGQVHLDSQK